MANINKVIASVQKNLPGTNIDIFFPTGEYDSIVPGIIPGPTPQPTKMMKIIVSDDDDNILRTCIIDEKRNVYRRIGGGYVGDHESNDWVLTRKSAFGGFMPKELIEIVRLMDVWCD